MKEQKVAELKITSAEAMMVELKELVNDGYRLAGTAPTLLGGGGAVFLRARGVYVDRALVWLDAAAVSPLYHC